MSKRITVLVITILLAGCVDGKFHKRSITGGPCGTVSGYTYTGIAYGDSKMVVIPVSKIRADTEWRFYLLPIDSLGGTTAYGDKTVKIDGKPPPYTPPANDDWIDGEKSYDTATVSGKSRYITVCVPSTVVKGQTWEYLVHVDTVGTLDPRGHVEK